MRTSIDIPDGLLREAKVAAENRGLTFDEFVTEALDHELHGTPAVPQKRLDFPLIRTGTPRSLRITNEDIRGVEEEDDTRGLDRLP